jgi:hypothetical protein
MPPCLLLRRELVHVKRNHNDPGTTMIQEFHSIAGKLTSGHIGNIALANPPPTGLFPPPL